jgi:ADP-heptose:LPS heptosyltransferase
VEIERGMRRVLVVRLDSIGDVLLAGPAIAATAAGGSVDVLCSSVGRPAAELLPGVGRTIVFDAPWILQPGPPVTADGLQRLINELGAWSYDAAAILTSSHQSALPTAMILRLAGIPRLAAVSIDYPGSLLDHRLRGDPDLHEVERALAVVEMIGVEVGDPATHRLRVDVDAAPPVPGRVVLHPGAAAVARTLPPARWRVAAAELSRRGYQVIVTGTPVEASLCATVAEPTGTPPIVLPPSELHRLAEVIGTAAVVVAGNTGPAHLAAAMGRPVVVVFAPTVPPKRWRPWGVPHVLLGDLDVACAGCRSIRCPLAEQVCLTGVTAEAVAHAVERLDMECADRLEVVG